MPKTITLPARKNTFQVPTEQVSEMAGLIVNVKAGQAIAMDEEGFATEGKALTRGRKMQVALSAIGHITKVHAIQDDGNAMWYPAISVNIARTRKARAAAKAAAEAEVSPDATEPVTEPAKPATRTKK